VTCLLWHRSVEVALTLLLLQVLSAHGQIELLACDAMCAIWWVSIRSNTFHELQTYLPVFCHGGVLLLALNCVGEFKPLPLWPIAGVTCDAATLFQLLDTTGYRDYGG
jgi:hypothetical protein